MFTTRQWFDMTFELMGPSSVPPTIFKFEKVIHCDIVGLLLLSTLQLCELTPAKTP